MINICDRRELKVVQEGFFKVFKSQKSEKFSLTLLTHSIMPPVSISSRALRIKARSIEAAIRHLGICIEIEKAATLALNQFQQRYTRVMIMNDPLLGAEETRLIVAKTKAWNDRFAAWRAANPPTLDSILWIVAKSGFTKEVAPFMNLSKATRECKNLQRVMREVRDKMGMTQLYYYCEKGMSSSVMRMLEMRSIDVEAKISDELGGMTCLHAAAANGHLDVCRLLIDKGAQIEAKSRNGLNPLKWAARNGHLETVRLLCDRGADIEACDNIGLRPLHEAAYYGHISIVKELIEVRNAEINARDNIGWTASTWGLLGDIPEKVGYYFNSLGAVD